AQGPWSCWGEWWRVVGRVGERQEVRKVGERSCRVMVGKQEE
nr:hypothetical protein [Tanacetum cinerariifolium]